MNNNETIKQNNNENEAKTEPKLNRWVQIAALIALGLIALNQGLAIVDKYQPEISRPSMVSETALSASPQLTLLTRHPKGQDMANRLIFSSSYDGYWECDTPRQITDFNFDDAGYQYATYLASCYVVGETLVENNGATQLQMSRNDANSEWHSQAVDLVPDKCLGSEGWWVFKDYFEHNCLQLVIRTPEADEMTRIEAAIKELRQPAELEFTWRAPGEVGQYTEKSK